MSTQVRVNIQTAGHIFSQVESVDGETAFVFGRVTGVEHTLAVSIHGGATRFFCQLHKQLYKPLETCPDCKAGLSPR